MIHDVVERRMLAADGNEVREEAARVLDGSVLGEPEAAAAALKELADIDFILSWRGEETGRFL